MAAEPLLELENLSVTIHTGDRSLTVVDDVSLSVVADEVSCIVGESGSGKSVSMLAVMRLLDERTVTYTGSIRFNGEDLLALAPRRMLGVRGAGISMIFQDPMTALNPVYRIGWQLDEQIRAHTDNTRAQARARALELLEHVGISDPARRLDAFPHELSGGMRQRVMIALALSSRPRVLIADEPTTALDVTVQSQILQLISTLKQETGMAVVLVTHDMGVVAEMADRVHVMYGGRIVEQGETAEIFSAAKHPYTQGLLASIPRLDLPRPHRLPSIPGVPGNAGQLAPGCVFAARCPARMPICDVQPALVAVDTGSSGGAGRSGGAGSHQVACHLVSAPTGSPGGVGASA